MAVACDGWGAAKLCSFRHGCSTAHSARCCPLLLSAHACHAVCGCRIVVGLACDSWCADTVRSFRHDCSTARTTRCCSLLVRPFSAHACHALCGCSISMAVA